MKRLLLLLILFALPAYAEDVHVARLGPWVGGGVPAVAVDECDGKLICQNFEGTGYDNQASETWTEDEGTPNEDYTTTALRGTQSLSVSDADDGDVASVSFTSQSTVYVHFRFRYTAMGASGSTFAQLWLTDDQIVGIYVFENGQIGTAHGTTEMYSGDTVLSAGTTYHFWIRYTAGSGANGVLTVWAGTTVNRSEATQFCTTSSGTDTRNINKIRLASAGAGATNTLIFDQVIVSSSDFSEVSN